MANRPHPWHSLPLALGIFVESIREAGIVLAESDRLLDEVHVLSDAGQSEYRADGRACAMPRRWRARSGATRSIGLATMGMQRHPRVSQRERLLVAREIILSHGGGSLVLVADEHRGAEVVPGPGGLL